MAITQYTVKPEMQERLGALTLREFTSILHLRGWCHDSVACPSCLRERQSTERIARHAKHIGEAFDLGRRDGIREIAEG